MVDSVINIGKQFLGKPYRFRNSTTPTLDCSGFICHIYDHLDVKLSRSSASQALETRRIDFSEVEPGDLLFFKGRNASSNTVGHVSMVIEVNDAGLKMIHSCQRGVIIDDYPMTYYSERFLFAGRLKEIDALNTTPTPQATLDDTLQKVKDNSARLLEKSSVTIVGVGDLMIGTNFPSSSHLPPNDGKDILVPAHAILQKADIAFGNLEGCILSGEGTVKKCNDPSKCYAFKSPDHYIEHYKNAGFDVLSIANNHVGDFGEVGRKNTARILTESGIHFAGLEDYPFSIFEKDSVTYGFCAFSPNTGTLKITDYAKAREIVQHLDSLCNIVIVSFHGGAEGAKYNRITRKTELFLGENRGNPFEFSRVVIDAGADVVLGHGPHVVRAVDIYKGRFIAYSLGNFATYSRFNLSGPNGLAPLIELKLTKKGEFLTGQIHSAKQLGEGGPTMDPTNAATEEIKRLTLLDFPEAPLLISEEGKISLKK
ncbi:MAG: CapA family protein [Crocinitomicaceae bacterium]|nr:CapA family protein [Crocinitomicaceae bacterium]